jgi:hypothetical protein
MKWHPRAVCCTALVIASMQFMVTASVCEAQGKTKRAGGDKAALFKAPEPKGEVAATEPPPASDSLAPPTFFVHRASPANTIGNSTYLDHPLINGDSTAIVVITPNFNPDGAGGQYNDHPIGVWYSNGRWAIFNQDMAPMAAGAAFNVWIADDVPGSRRRAVRRKRSSATASDSDDMWSAIRELQKEVKALAERPKP